jgi:ferredoxin
MIEAAQSSSAILNFNTDIVDVFVPEAKIAKKITIASVVKEADAIISLPKLKTHGMCLFTGAVKNMFGIIPGTTKMEYHFRMNKIDDFSDMLIDVCKFANPVLSVMDAVIGMEGNGPSAGIPRAIGAIIAGCSPYAVDVAATDLVGIKPNRVTTIVKAEERGLCSASPENIVFLGDHFKKPYITDFKLPESAKRGLLSKILDVTGNSGISKWLKPKVEPKPVIRYNLCKGCGDCERCCPPKAIRMQSAKPEIDMEKCIKCYCCQELCPEKAVIIGRNWAFKLFK